MAERPTAIFFMPTALPWSIDYDTRRQIKRERRKPLPQAS